MAGTWMSIVEGFGGMRVKTINCTFRQKSQKSGKDNSFKINFRNQNCNGECKSREYYFLLMETTLEIVLNGTETTVKSISSFSIKPAESYILTSYQ
jgi:maltose phosphorylase